jgi:hypothetical protein
MNLPIATEVGFWGLVGREIFFYLPLGFILVSLQVLLLARDTIHRTNRSESVVLALSMAIVLLFAASEVADRRTYFEVFKPTEEEGSIALLWAAVFFGPSVFILVCAAIGPALIPVNRIVQFFLFRRSTTRRSDSAESKA